MILLPLFEMSPFESEFCSCDLRRRRLQKNREAMIRRRLLEQFFADPVELFRHHLDGQSEDEQKKTRPADQSFCIKVRTTDFKPDEITLTIQDRRLSIHAKHEATGSSPFVSREMCREFIIPPNVDPETIVAKMNKDGLLTISVASDLIPEKKVPEELTSEESKETQVVSGDQETGVKTVSQVQEPQKAEETTASENMETLEHQKTSKETPVDPESRQQPGRTVSEEVPEPQKAQETTASDEHMEMLEHHKPGTYKQVIAVKNSFSIPVEIKGFNPDEITVKIKDGQLSIHAKHEEKDSGSFVYREMRREFTIPSDVDPNTIVADMKSDGILRITSSASTLPEKKTHQIILEKNQQSESTTSEEKLVEVRSEIQAEKDNNPNNESVPQGA